MRDKIFAPPTRVIISEMRYNLQIVSMRKLCIWFKTCHFQEPIVIPDVYTGSWANAPQTPWSSNCFRHIIFRQMKEGRGPRVAWVKVSLERYIDLKNLYRSVYGCWISLYPCLANKTLLKSCRFRNLRPVFFSVTLVVPWDPSYFTSICHLAHTKIVIYNWSIGNR